MLAARWFLVPVFRVGVSRGPVVLMLGKSYHSATLPIRDSLVEGGDEKVVSGLSGLLEEVYSHTRHLLSL